MEQTIRDQFNEAILTRSLQYYDLVQAEVVSLDGFESFIFDIRNRDKAFILRIGHDSRRSPDLVQGEAEFLNHLARGGLSVPQVLPSKQGRLVETVESGNGTHFLATLFEKAPGRPPQKADWQPDLFLSMGKFMGKLHYLSKTFLPSQERFRRYDIEADFVEMENIGRKHLPVGDEPVLQSYRDTVRRISQLPRDNHSYGLCHVDFHRGNFFVTPEGKITLFDFDDCQYAWFVYDIAMALFYAVSHNCISHTALDEAGTFLSFFWRGYSAENALSPDWLEKIPLFLRLREIDLYMIIHRSMDLDNLDPWCKSYLDGRRDKILHHDPYCDIDYQEIARSNL